MRTDSELNPSTIPLFLLLELIDGNMTESEIMHYLENNGVEYEPI